MGVLIALVIIGTLVPFTYSTYILIKCEIRRLRYEKIRKSK
jgi:hypothetical protein